MEARAIISMAQKMEEIIGKQNLISQHDQQQEAMAESTVLPLPPSPSSETLPQMLNPGLSMKRSLQRFLQKRKARISEVTPYKQTPKLLFPLKPQHAWWVFVLPFGCKKIMLLFFWNFFLICFRWYRYCLTYQVSSRFLIFECIHVDYTCNFFNLSKSLHG